MLLVHGLIFFELKKFVDSELPEGSWDKIIADAGLADSYYTPLREYPDAEAGALVAAASKLANVDAQAVLASFGEFIAPHLLGMYKHLIKPSWKTLEVIENTENVIHEVVRVKNPGAHPPVLKAKRISPKELELHYGSQRKMCAVAKGISKGIAAHFGESLAVTERSCMLQGALECVIGLRIP